nr:hypothetical protein [uncultured Flavobacterium sp.]
MNKILFFVCLISASIVAQNKFDKIAGSIVREGKMLYRSEMSSWYGTDLFLEKFKDQSKIGGYFSYSEENITKCIFVSKENNLKVIGTIIFDNSFDISKAITDLNERSLNETEIKYLNLRKKSIEIISNDTLFKQYENMNLNVIPIINNGENKVYVLSGPKKNGVVIFGNDYLIEFDKSYNVKSKKQLHKNIIPIEYKNDDGKDAETMHSHLPETGDFITATDICTLMLYEKFAKWKNHIVVSKKYVSIWNCKTDELFVMTSDAMKEIASDK